MDQTDHFDKNDKQKENIEKCTEIPVAIHQATFNCNWNFITHLTNSVA